MNNDYMTREGQVMPNAFRRAVEFCAPVTDNNTTLATVNKAAVPALLNLPQYVGVDTMVLIAKATARLVSKKLATRDSNSILHRFVNPTDRPTAIAVLEGVR